MYIDTNSIITAASILTAMGVLVGILVAVIKFIAHPKEQDEEIGRIKKVHADDMKAINKEQCLITYGLLACLKEFLLEPSDAACPVIEWFRTFSAG